MKCHFTPIRLEKNQKSDNIKCCKDMEEQKLFVNIPQISHTGKDAYILRPSDLTIRYMTWRNSGMCFRRQQDVHEALYNTSKIKSNLNAHQQSK